MRKLPTFIITMIIGGFIGLQSTISNTAKAETEFIPVIMWDTVTNTIIDKRVVTKTDTVVRNVAVPTPVRDEIWAAKAVRHFPLTEMSDIPLAVKENIEHNVSID